MFFSRGISMLLYLWGIVLCFIVMIQFKQIYLNQLKNGRLQDYKQYVNEIAEELDEIEKSANKSFSHIQLLNEEIFKQRERKLENNTQSQLGSSLSIRSM